MVCRDDPRFPSYIQGDGNTANVNFTTTYEAGVGAITADLDHVRFTCPDGFYFDGTNQVDVYAFCHGGKWNESFDTETFCRRKSRKIGGWGGNHHSIEQVFKA